MSDRINTSNPAIAYYLVAKKEMLLRIKEREVATYVWIGVLGTIITVAFHGQYPNYDILLSLPLLSLCIAMRISQHETIISKLANYCKKEIGPIIQEQTEYRLVHWDESRSLNGQVQIVGLRTFVNLILIVGPSICALVVTFGNFLSGVLLYKCVWVLDLIFTCLSSYFCIKSVIYRLKMAIKTQI